MENEKTLPLFFFEDGNDRSEKQLPINSIKQIQRRIWKPLNVQKVYIALSHRQTCMYNTQKHCMPFLHEQTIKA